MASDAAAGTVVGITAQASDPDAGDMVSYSLDNDFGGTFAIDPTTGVVTVADPTALGGVGSASIVIRATSSDGSFTTENFDINVSDGTVPIAVDDSAIVDESSLATGTNAGAGADVASGNLFTNDDLQGAAITSINGVTPVGNTITVTTLIGELVVDSVNGDYTYTLIDATEEGLTDTEVFTYTLTQADGDAATASLTVNVVDDAVVAASGPDVINFPTSFVTNLAVIVDMSSSMDNTDRGLAKDAIDALQSQYEAYGTVNVNVVEFWGDNNSNSGWNDSSSYNYNFVTGTSGTDIEQGLREMVENSYNGNQPDADQNVMYFVGDGDTYGSYQADFNAFLPTWENFVTSGDVDKLFTYSVNTSEVLRDIDLLAVSSEDIISEPAVNVTDIADLSTFVTQTVSLYSTGTVHALSSGPGSLDSGAIFGADGGFIASVVIDGVTYVRDAANPVQDVSGTYGTMKLDFNTGDFTYELNTPATGLIGVENIEFYYEDGDGDTGYSNIDFYVTQYNETVGTAFGETLMGDADNDLILGFAGDDIIDGAGESDFIRGGDGDDTIYGGTGDDVLVGGAGNDELHGQDGMDNLRGGAGDDRLDGGLGNDILVGGAGDDILVGDGGSDTFVWESGDQGSVLAPASDLVEDFTAGVGGDALDLRDLLSGEDASSNLSTYLSFEQSGSDTVLHISSDGGFSGGYIAAAENQTIVLEGIDLTAGGTMSDQQIIDALLATNNLITD